MVGNGLSHPSTVPSSAIGGDVSGGILASAGPTQLQSWIEQSLAEAPNRDRLRARLRAIDNVELLLRFFCRFLIFNDALAARVPFLAGVIHLHPDVFVDQRETQVFCRQVNGQIAAHVAEAASDEYHFSPTQNLVHQHLSQRFFRALLRYHGTDPVAFDQRQVMPAELAAILADVRSAYFASQDDGEIFAALGFHVALELFADEEFNIVDEYLKERHPDLVSAMSAKGNGISDYSWLAIHTVVEIRHYRAGLDALEKALHFYHRQEDAGRMQQHIKDGFRRFVDLQYRFYEAILENGE